MPQKITAPLNRGDVIADLELRSATGDRVTLGSQLNRRTIIPLVRYYGCMPCRDFLFQLQEAKAELDEAGIDILGVGRAADYQAVYMAEHGITYPLLLDPDESLYNAVGLGRFPWWKLFSVKAAVNYLRAGKRARQGRPTNHPLQSPGVLIVDPDRRIHFVFRGETIGDYPPLSDVIAAATTSRIRRLRGATCDTGAHDSNDHPEV